MSIEDLTGTIVRKICMACSREFSGGGNICPHDGNMLVALPQDPYVGRRIADKYHVLSVLGTGGMGVVYLARHETMQCNVAIKMLRAQFVSDTSSVRRFNHEAIAAGRLTHPNIINTSDFGFTPQGQPYIVMEVLEGKSLADEIKRLKQMSVDRVIHIFSQACDAIEHAHKQGIIHRDLKPGNIMLINFNDDPDFVKVVDFGVAKFLPGKNSVDMQTLTQAGEVCGSPVYMSPEQCLGQDLDRRADVYSMGVVIYESLTGKLPLLGKNMVETMSKHINETPPAFKDVRPDLYIPDRVEQAVMRALSKNPDGRQPNMAMLKQDLTFAVPHPGQKSSLRNIASVTSTISDPEPIEKASWVVPAIAAGVTALVVAGASIFYFGQKQAGTAVQGTAVPVVRTAAGINTAVTPASLAPATVSPATVPVGVTFAEVPSSSTVAPNNESSPANSLRASSLKQPATPLTKTPAHLTPAQVAVNHTPVNIPKAIPKHTAQKRQTKIALTPKPHHTPAAAAKPRPSSSIDPFAALSKERTYKVNN